MLIYYIIGVIVWLLCGFIPPLVVGEPITTNKERWILVLFTFGGIITLFAVLTILIEEDEPT